MNELRELYRRESEWLLILPEVERRMAPRDLDHAVERHLEQTVARVIRLEELFDLMKSADSRSSLAMRPLLREMDEVLAAVTRSSQATRWGSDRRPTRVRGTPVFFAADCQN